MWIGFLVALIVAATIHSRFSRTSKAELYLVYLLAGYCGIAQVAFGLAMLFAPAEWQLAHMPRVQPYNPSMAWVAFLWLGMGAIGTMTIWLRGVFMVAPLVAWMIFWTGATVAHSVYDGQLTPHSFIHIFAGHGLVAVLLASFAASLWRASRTQA